MTGKRKAYERVESINRLLVFTNVLLGCIFFLSLISFFKDDIPFFKKESDSQTIRYQKDTLPLIILVLDDKTFEGILKDKQVSVISLNPLTVTVLPSKAIFEKNGYWQLFSNHRVIIKNYSGDQYIKGEKISVSSY